MQVVNQKVFYLNPSDAVHGGIGAIGKDDIVIMISKGGSTNELCSFLGNLKSKEAFIVYVGENENSTNWKISRFILEN